MKKMHKWISSFVVLCMLLVMVPVTATATDVRQVGTESELLSAVAEGGSIQLTANLTINNTTWIEIADGQTVNIDLNGYTISKNQKVFLVKHGTLNLTGTGTVQETVDDGYGAIWIKSTATSTDTNWANVNIGENVTLRGWAPLTIDQNGAKAYGVSVVLNGKCASPVTDGTVAGHGIYVNGSVHDPVNCPQVTIGSTAVVENPLGVGIYAGGHVKWTVEAGASVTGQYSAIAIKNGDLCVNGGTFHCTGEDSTPTTPNSNGVAASGAALQIESNASYGEMKINLKGGTFTSDNGTCVYEYAKDDVENVNQLNISGGTFTGAKGVFMFSDMLALAEKVNVTGGVFSADPTDFVATGYVAVPASGTYAVKKTVTDMTIDDAIAPVTGGTPVTSLSTDEYTVDIAWAGNPDKFAAATDYTATITLTAKDGYTFTEAGELAITDMKEQTGGASSDSTRIVEASFATTANDVSLPTEAVSDAIETGKTSGEVKMDVADVENLTAVSIPTEMITAALENESIDKVTVELPEAAVTLDATALETLSDAEEVVLNVTPVAADKLTTEQVKALGDKAASAIVLDISLLVDGSAQSTFNGGKLTISVPYTPKDGEDTSTLTVWYLKDDGTVENMGGKYDKTTGCFVFETSHLSEYALVSVEAPETPVEDPVTPVETGDSNFTMLWAVLAVFCATAFIAVGVSGMKRYRGKHIQ